MTQSKLVHHQTSKCTMKMYKASSRFTNGENHVHHPCAVLATNYDPPKTELKASLNCDAGNIGCLAHYGPAAVSQQERLAYCGWTLVVCMYVCVVIINIS